MHREICEILNVYNRENFVEAIAYFSSCYSAVDVACLSKLHQKVEQMIGIIWLAEHFGSFPS